MIWSFPPPAEATCLSGDSCAREINLLVLAGCFQDFGIVLTPSNSSVNPDMRWGNRW